MPAGEELLRQGRRVDHEAEHGEVLNAAGVGPEQAEEHVALAAAHTLGRHVDLLRPRVARRQVEHVATHVGIANESAGTTVEQHAGRRRGVRPPCEEALDVRVGLETFGELTGHKLHAAGAQSGD